MKRNLSIMVKPASSACNLQCRYCFYRDVAQSRTKASFGIMTAQTCENLIRKSLEFGGGGSICFTFQGGEPLLAGKEFYKQFLSLAEKYNTNGSEIIYCLQTNGTLIDAQWADFFAENNFLIGLSLDGDKDANCFRFDNDSKSTFDKVIEAAELLKGRKVEFNVLCVATGYTANNIEDIYSYFKGLNLKYLQFVPCLRPFGDKSESQLFMSAEQYASFLIKLFKLYADDWAKGNYISIRGFDNYVNLFLGANAEQCGMNGFCSRQFVVEGNGNVYPCDFYCLDEWLLGNINADDFESIASSPRAYEFLRSSVNKLSKCQECQYYYLCRGGGCKRARESQDYCEAYKKFFKECLPLFSVFKN